MSKGIVRNLYIEKSIEVVHLKRAIAELRRRLHSEGKVIRSLEVRVGALNREIGVLNALPASVEAQRNITAAQNAEELRKALLVSDEDSIPRSDVIAFLDAILGAETA